MADQSAVIIKIGGGDVTAFARVGLVRIDDVLNNAPNSAALTLIGGVPWKVTTGPFDKGAYDNAAFNTALGSTPSYPINPGAPVEIFLGFADADHLIFGGQIVTREQFAELDRDKPAHVRYHVTCTDYTRRLNKRKVLKAYGQQSATAIVLDVIASFAPTITTVNVAPGLATITGGITFTFEEVSRALSRIAEKIGAYWFVDYVGDLHFFVGTEAGTEPAPLVPGADFANLKIRADLSQVRTRIVVEGNGTTTRAACAVGATSIPIVDGTPFNPAGGLAVADGAARFAYASAQVGGGAGAVVVGPLQAPGAPVAANAAGVGGLLAGAYLWAVTFMASSRESERGALSNAVTIPAVPAPAAAPTCVLGPGVGAILVGTYRYRVTFQTADGETTAGPNSANISVSEVIFPAQVGNLSATTGGNMAPGFYNYGVSFTTATGETIPQGGGTGVTLSGGNNAVQVTTMQVSTDPRVTGKKLYRTDPTYYSGYRLVAALAANVTAYKDTLAGAGLGTEALQAPTTQQDGLQITLSAIPVSADSRVIRRKIYREKFISGPANFTAPIHVGTVDDNTTTTFIDDGRTTGTGPPATTTARTGRAALTSIPLGPAGTTARRIYRSNVNGSDLKFLDTLADNTTATYTDTKPDDALGATAPTVSAWPIPAGATSIAVTDTAPFSDSGGWLVMGEQTIRYTGRSTTSGPGMLTGIPPTGPGSITAPIIPGDGIAAAGVLVVPAGIPSALALDAEVNVLAQVDDGPAQAALAAAEGGDGIVEHYIQDRRLTLAGATARGTADLALFKTVETRVSYTTHDPNTRSGRTVHIALPAPTSITGDFLIQRVSIDDVSIAKNFFPKRSVDASTTRFSFDDVLNRLLMEQA